MYSSPKYSYAYSRDVVFAFVETCPRATWSLEICLGKEQGWCVETLINSFRCHQLKWNIQKKFLKNLEKDEDVQDVLLDGSIPRKDRLEYLKRLGWIACDEVLDTLDHTDHGNLAQIDT